MPIVGHGIDIVQTQRIRESVQEHAERFLDRVFTPAEQQYCSANKKRYFEHLAGRFAAKEAVLKVLGTGWRGGIAWTDIEIVNEPSGQPKVKLSGECLRIATEQGIAHWHVSISHIDTHATASAIGLRGKADTSIIMQQELISVAEAIAVLDAVEISPRAVEVELERAHGLRLAQEIAADRDYPPFDKSLMDGFAVRSADTGQRTIVGEIAAGQTSSRAVAAGEAMAIMTGAPIPPGADAVVPIEDCTITSPSPGTPGEGRGGGSEISNLKSQIEKSPHPNPLPAYQERGLISFDSATRTGMNITRRGADCQAGTIILQRGVKLEAPQLAVAASVGAAKVRVFAAPRAAVLSTGDELVSIDSIPGPAQIRNSNNIMLTSLLRRLGCEVTDLGVARDEPDVIRAAIQKGLQFDLLFVSGGMSMGQYDYVPKILRELGVDLKITKLRIKPGKPFVFGTKAGNAFVFGLPGNPVSSFVCTLRLCSRLIAKMLGADSIQRWTDAKLESPVEPNGGREFYQPAILAGPSVKPLKWKGSADIYTLARANALIVRPENAPGLEAGTSVRVLEIPS